jgi:hypothetical protein
MAALSLYARRWHRGHTCAPLVAVTCGRETAFAHWRRRVFDRVQTPHAHVLCADRGEMYTAIVIPVCELRSTHSGVYKTQNVQ